ncbi:hypothetical protein DDE05_09005 [Streptomyces cavourensis]|nr:hypothetical protein DDE05_09005 [Streptomyces cavourensis]
MPFQFDGPVAEDHSGTRSLGSGDPAYSRHFLQAQLREGRIQAWFQPKWRLKDGAVIGAEALARWIGPEGCAAAPGDFLRHVRHHGLERELLFRMLDDAISAHVKWRDLGNVYPYPSTFLLLCWTTSSLPTSCTSGWSPAASRRSRSVLSCWKTRLHP